MLTVPFRTHPEVKMDKVKEFFGKCWSFIKDTWAKVVKFAKPIIDKVVNFTVTTTKKFVAWLKTVKWKIVWDHITTGILILLMASPFLILAWLVIWFLNK